MFCLSIAARQGSSKMKMLVPLPLLEKVRDCYLLVLDVDLEFEC